TRGTGLSPAGCTPPRPAGGIRGDRRGECRARRARICRSDARPRRRALLPRYSGGEGARSAMADGGHHRGALRPAGRRVEHRARQGLLGGASATDRTRLDRRASGLSVTTEAHGTSRPLSPAVDRAAYRILQEALTNAARHGGGSAAVAIRFGPQVLELTVTNPLSGSSSAAGGGHGIVGMRERAGLLGGSLDA